ncbi:hypothetical protein ACLQ2R_17625 [Streptosporangium sp. DT93]|uniref:hypothetical protein n=1 Tax=Streptosporangium sp. DT93 TaxID=3393428 RepID=UPI003CEE74C8
MSTPYNTSKTDPLLLLADAMGPGGVGAAIERQEKQGQRELVNSDVIPADLGYGSEEELTALGFTLGAPVSGDKLFRHAELPPGWKREGSGHAMWSHIVDELGRKRLAIFYKAAYYDRSAHASIVSVSAYINDCLDEGVEPVLDDVWATREAVKAAAEGCIAQSTKYLKMYEGLGSSYDRERAAELRAEIAAYQALYAAVDGGAAATRPADLPPEKLQQVAAEIVAHLQAPEPGTPAAGGDERAVDGPNGGA